MAGKGGRKKAAPKGLAASVIDGCRKLAPGWWLAIMAVVAALLGSKAIIGKDGITLVPAAATDTQADRGRPREGTRDTGNVARQIEAIKTASIPLDALPAELRGNGTREDAERLIKELVAAHNDSFATVESCVRWLEYAIETRRMELNTSKPGVQQDTEFRGYVRSLQVCLTVLGSYSGPLDGQCPSLLQAVLAYQKSKGLKPDGIVGRQTWLRIKADVIQALRAKNTQPDA